MPSHYEIISRTGAFAGSTPDPAVARVIADLCPGCVVFVITVDEFVAINP